MNNDILKNLSSHKMNKVIRLLNLYIDKPKTDFLDDLMKITDDERVRKHFDIKYVCDEKDNIPRYIEEFKIDGRDYAYNPNHKYWCEDFSSNTLADYVDCYMDFVLDAIDEMCEECPNIKVLKKHHEYNGDMPFYYLLSNENTSESIKSQAILLIKYTGERLGISGQTITTIILLLNIAPVDEIMKDSDEEVVMKVITFVLKDVFSNTTKYGIAPRDMLLLTFEMDLLQDFEYVLEDNAKESEKEIIENGITKINNPYYIHGNNHREFNTTTALNFAAALNKATEKRLGIEFSKWLDDKLFIANALDGRTIRIDPESYPMTEDGKPFDINKINMEKYYHVLREMMNDRE